MLRRRRKVYRGNEEVSVDRQVCQQLEGRFLHVTLVVPNSFGRWNSFISLHSSVLRLVSVHFSPSKSRLSVSSTASTSFSFEVRCPLTFCLRYSIHTAYVIKVKVEFNNQNRARSFSHHGSVLLKVIKQRQSE